MPAPNFDDPNISEECLRCREKGIAKSKTGVFETDCTGIFPAAYKLEQNIGRPLSESEAEAANTLLDPVGWANAVLGWVPRVSKDNVEYQGTMLRCDARRKLSRIGRRAGKTDTLCIDMLYNATTKKGEKVLVVCPQKSHAQVIYDRLLELIYSSPDLNGSLKRNVKTPYAEIEFHNDSIIKLFTSGSKTGSKGQGIRGQSADRVYLDEADYLDTEDINALSAILYTSPNVTFWTSSTPSGRREKFYEQAHDSRFREYHFTSHVLPFWNDQMDRDAKMDAGTEAGYSHEVLAEWGEEVEGVYQNKYIDRSNEEFQYEDQVYESGWRYTMGVDWNDSEIGTQIVIVGFNPAISKYRMVAKYCVDRIGWTQLAAIDKIVEVNQYWKCEAIYVDQGYGSVQIELLQEYGERKMMELGANHPDAKLRDVKGIHSGGNLETRNIRTGVIENKSAKPYMIENSVRYFEHNMIETSVFDDELNAELLGYVVERRTSTGAPVYAQGNKRVGDHLLDALVLSLLAFTMEYTEFGQILSRSFVAFGGGFGEFKQALGGKGDVQVIVEQKSIKRQDDKKREAMKPQERFNTTNNSVLNRGIPADLSGNSAVRTSMEKQGSVVRRGLPPIRRNV